MLRILIFTIMLSGLIVRDVTVAKDSSHLSAADKAAIVTRFATEVKYNFAHLDNVKGSWDSICSARLPEIVATHSDEAFLDSLKLLCATLHDGHTAVWCNTPAVRDWPLPFFTKRFGNRVFVTDVITDSMIAAGLRPGTEVLEIDHLPVIDYGRRNVIPYLPSSTPQWSEFESFFGGWLTNGPVNRSVNVKFCNGPDSVFSLNVVRDMNWQHNPYLKQTVSFRMLPDNVGYIKIPSFQEGRFDGNTFLEAYDSLRNVSGLIIDIRDNNGGNSLYGNAIMQLICTDTIQGLPWSSPQYVAVRQAWGQPQELYQKEGGELVPICMETSEIAPFTAPVILLVNSGTFSASEDFAALFKAANRGLIVGTPTGGSTGQPIMIDLGHGYASRICARNEWLPDGTRFIGVGIIPDVMVEETAEIFSGIDRVLEKALSLLPR